MSEANSHSEGNCESDSACRCAVCLDVRRSPAFIRLKNCVHVFHYLCLADAVKAMIVGCPLCRTRLSKREVMELTVRRGFPSLEAYGLAYWESTGVALEFSEDGEKLKTLNGRCERLARVVMEVSPWKPGRTEVEAERNLRRLKRARRKFRRYESGYVYVGREEEVTCDAVTHNGMQCDMEVKDSGEYHCPKHLNIE